MLLFVSILGIIFIGIGGTIIIKIKNPNFLGDHLKDFLNDKMTYYVIVILAGICLIIALFSKVNEEWKIVEKDFLAPVGIEDSYLFVNEEEYVYCKKKPGEKSETQLIITGKDAIVEIESISEDNPYMVKYKKDKWIGEKYKYVFYIPEQK